MNFADMVAEVIIWTKRPDLVSATHSAIRGNTLKYHRREKFFKDLAYVYGVGNPVQGNYAMVLDPIRTYFPQWRQFKSIKYANSLKGLTKIDANAMIDQDGYDLFDVYLVAGTSLNVKGSIPVTGLDVIYYKDPIVTPEGSYSSWIADEQPDLIIAGSAARVLSFDNESEIFKAAKQEESEQWMTLVASNLEEDGR